MSFQIIDNTGDPIAIDVLDREVCELWGVEYDIKWYAKPNPRSHYEESFKGAYEHAAQNNWFDSIGYAIHSKKLNTWEEVINHFYGMYGKIIEEYKVKLSDLIPKEIKLIEHWVSKNYKPRYIK